MLTKALIGVSALVSAGFIAGVDPMPRRAEAPAKFADRFPTFEELMLHPGRLETVALLSAGIASAAPAAAAPALQAPAASAAPKGDRLPVVRGGGCDREVWPYIASDCLTSIDGSPVRRPARTITIERRVQNGSILVQAELSDLVVR